MTILWRNHNIFDEFNLIGVIFFALLHCEVTDDEAEIESASFAILRIDTHVPTKVGYDPLADIQPHANALLVLLAAALKLTKDLEELDLIVSFDANTCVNYTEEKFIVLRIKININCNCAIGGELHCI